MDSAHDICARDLGLGPAPALAIDIACGCLSGSGQAIGSLHVKVLVVAAVVLLQQGGGPFVLIEDCCLAMDVGRLPVDLLWQVSGKRRTSLDSIVALKKILCAARAHHYTVIRMIQKHSILLIKATRLHQESVLIQLVWLLFR